MSTLLCIDPGGRAGGQTGIVLFEFGTRTPARVRMSWAVNGGLEGFVKWAERSGAGLHPDHTVIEHFVNWNVPGADLTPVLVEGAARALFRGPTTLQTASGKNSMVTDAVLKKMDLWFPGDNHHDRREAARHGLIWLKNRKHRPTLEAMYGTN